jgi:hypothetical protein
MEVVLLWLDDLDDLAFSAALKWEQARQLCLQVGLLASLTLVGCEVCMTASVWAPKLALVAAGSVAVWLLAAAVAAVRRLEAGFPDRYGLQNSPSSLT